MWEDIPPERRLGVIQSYTISGHIQQFSTDTNLRQRRSLPQSLMVNISDELRECLMSSNRSESFVVTVNASQLSVTISNLGTWNGTSGLYHNLLYTDMGLSL